MASVKVARAFVLWLSLYGFTCASHAEEQIFHGINVPDQSGKVMTVTGAISPSRLGDTLMHEHLLLKLALPLDQPERWVKLGRFMASGARKTWLTPPATPEELALWHMPFTVRNRGKLSLPQYGLLNEDNWTLDDMGVAIREVQAYQELGGQTIVDVTTIGLGRQPEKIRAIAEKTGVNIVLGTGFYNDAWHPKDMSERSLLNLTKVMVREIAEGIGNTNIRAGLIGEIPVDDIGAQPENSDKTRVLQAAARASRLTGAAISLHGDFREIQHLHPAIDILEAEGADLSRVVMGHITAVAAADIAFLESLLQRGIYLQFDLLGYSVAGLSPIEMEAIETLIKRGYSKQLLVSQDVCTKAQLKENGGFGFTFVHSVLLPYLRQQDVSGAAITDLLQNNPKRVLTFVKPRT